MLRRDLGLILFTLQRFIRFVSCHMFDVLWAGGVRNAFAHAAFVSGLERVDLSNWSMLVFGWTGFVTVTKYSHQPEFSLGVVWSIKEKIHSPPFVANG